MRVGAVFVCVSGSVPVVAMLAVALMSTMLFLLQTTALAVVMVAPVERQSRLCHGRDRCGCARWRAVARSAARRYGPCRLGSVCGVAVTVATTMVCARARPPFVMVVVVAALAHCACLSCDDATDARSAPSSRAPTVFFDRLYTLLYRAAFPPLSIFPFSPKKRDVSRSRGPKSQKPLWLRKAPTPFFALCASRTRKRRQRPNFQKKAAKESGKKRASGRLKGVCGLVHGKKCRQQTCPGLCASSIFFSRRNNRAQAPSRRHADFFLFFFMTFFLSHIEDLGIERVGIFARKRRAVLPSRFVSPPFCDDATIATHHKKHTDERRQERKKSETKRQQAPSS